MFDDEVLYANAVDTLNRVIPLINQLYLDYNKYYFSGNPKIYRMNKLSYTDTLNAGML